MQNLTLEQMIQSAEGKVCEEGLRELKDKNYKTLEEALGDPNAPDWAYWYAIYVLKGPFAQGEDAIATSADWSYRYAKSVLKGPFVQGEDAIATSAVWSYWYARDVLKGPFAKGEDVIATSAQWSYRYAKGILNDPNPDTWGKRHLSKEIITRGA